MNITESGQVYQYEFSFTQEQVDQFAALSGDTNPIHTDKEYAAQTIFGKPIIHGYFGTSVFSKVFGTMFPGEGTIYLEQTLQFMAPMFVDQLYKANFKVVELPGRNKAKVETTIVDASTNKTCVQGQALILNKTRII
jgi:acyl dehydratase